MQGDFVQALVAGLVGLVSGMSFSIYLIGVLASKKYKKLVLPATPVGGSSILQFVLKSQHFAGILKIEQEDNGATVLVPNFSDANYPVFMICYATCVLVPLGIAYIRNVFVLARTKGLAQLNPEDFEKQ